MTPEQRKHLLAALIKDRDQTREALEFIKQQKQHEETMYWVMSSGMSMALFAAPSADSNGSLMKPHEKTKHLIEEGANITQLLNAIFRDGLRLQPTLKKTF